MTTDAKFFYHNDNKRKKQSKTNLKKSMF